MTKPQEKSGPDIESVMANWITDRFGIKIRIRHGTVHDPLLVWEHWIIARFHKTAIESGSWVRPKDLHLVEVGDPKLFEKLEPLIQTRLEEIARDYGYAGQLHDRS